MGIFTRFIGSDSLSIASGSHTGGKRSLRVKVVAQGCRVGSTVWVEESEIIRGAQSLIAATFSGGELQVMSGTLDRNEPLMTNERPPFVLAFCPDISPSRVRCQIRVPIYATFDAKANGENAIEVAFKVDKTSLPAFADGLLRMSGGSVREIRLSAGDA